MNVAEHAAASNGRRATQAEAMSHQLTADGSSLIFVYFLSAAWASLMCIMAASIDLIASAL